MPQDPVASPEELTVALRAAGLSVTTGRLAVYAAVSRLGHCDADHVARVVRAESGSISKQSVYDSLRTLTELGLLRRVEPAGHSALYETRVADNHHHVVCRSCGLVADLDCEVGGAPCLLAPDTGGFVVDEAEITFWGICPGCRREPVDCTA